MRLKKIIASVLALATVSTVGAMSVSAAETIGYSTPTEPGTYLYGDVDQSGEVRVNDIQLIRRSILHIDESMDGNRIADVSKDGQVRVNDILLIRRVLLHLDDALGSFTIYADNVLGGDTVDVIDAIGDVTNVDKDTISEVSTELVSILDSYSKMSAEEKANLDCLPLIKASVEKATALATALQNADTSNADTLATTISNIVSVYEELKATGVDKNTILQQIQTLLADNNITFDANTQAYLLSVLAQAKAICDANGGVITGEQLLAIVNSLK